MDWHKSWNIHFMCLKRGNANYFSSRSTSRSNLVYDQITEFPLASALLSFSAVYQMLACTYA